MEHCPNACLEELEAFMTLWDVKPQVEESSLEILSVDELITQLRKMCEDAKDRAKGDKVKFASSTLLDSALTWWNMFDVTKWLRLGENHVTSGNGMETITPTTPTTLATSTRTNVQRQQGCLQPGKVLMLVSYLNAESMDDTTLTHALLLVTTVERQDIRPKTVELHLVPQTKEDQEAREDREAMSLVSDVVKKDIIRTSVRTMEVKAVETKFEATNKSSNNQRQIKKPKGK
ncbi:hypothetical protein Tco_0910357 [Tanacetum coccineum]|uniref:Uncharacterized protein n=1 Tax=Tanacetum coccineum TaxID=301880 RepID=A0ABQ5CUE2_9ASTR